MKQPEKKVFVPSEQDLPTTVESAIGIDTARFRQLGFIMDDIWAASKTKADAINALADRADLTTTEKVYMGYKLHEWICRKKVPMWDKVEKLL